MVGQGRRGQVNDVGMKPTNGFVEALKDEDESLKLFIKKMAQFDKQFCELMAGGSDFTLRLEVHGNKGSVLHVRCYTDDTERPNSAGRNSK